jgi:integrase
VGTKQQATEKLTALVGAAHRGEYVEPSTVTVLDWLRRWLEVSVKPRSRPKTTKTYASLIEQHVAKDRLGLMPLQKVRTSDIERYLAERTTLSRTRTSSAKPLSAASLAVHYTVLRSAFKKAIKDKVLTITPVVDVERRRTRKDKARGAREHCWNQWEARRFLETAAAEDTQTAAYMWLALDSGARKSELNGLTWGDVNLDTGTVTIARQLDTARLTADGEVQFGPTKTDQARVVTLGPDTVTRLLAHKRSQSALKMKNRAAYVDLGLVFAREPRDLQTPLAQLGHPLTTLAEKRFQKVIALAGVKRLKFHGCRHTSISLLLAAGVPVHVVAQRVGHSTVTQTLQTYAHALPDMQQDAARKLAQVLHG